MYFINQRFLVCLKSVHARVPRIIIDAKYIVDGKVLVLPITGKGAANLTLGKSFVTL